MQSALHPMHFALLNFLGQCKLHYGQCSLHCSFFWANANCILGNVVCIGFFWLYSRKHTNNMHVCNVFIMGLLWLPNVFDHIREFAFNVSLLLVLAFHVHQGCLQYGFIHGSCVSCAWRLIATCFFIVMALAFACIAFTEFLNMTRSFWFFLWTHGSWQPISMHGVLTCKHSLLRCVFFQSLHIPIFLCLELHLREPVLAVKRNLWRRN